MKICITSTLLFLLFTHLTHAQEKPYPDISRVSAPYSFLTSNALYGKNFYFENKWVRAKLLMADNAVISNDSFFYNFDKIERRLLFTTNLKQFFEIDRREFKAVMFYVRDTAYIFKHIPFINDKDLFQVIINESSKYSLYKVMRTKLVRNFTGQFFTTPANRQFETYVDIPEYFIFFPNREYRSVFMPKKAAIKRAFKLNPDSDKVSSYLDMYGGTEYNEQELIKLIKYLNSSIL